MAVTQLSPARVPDAICIYCHACLYGENAACDCNYALEAAVADADSRCPTCGSEDYPCPCVPPLPSLACPGCGLPDSCMCDIVF